MSDLPLPRYTIPAARGRGKPKLGPPLKRSQPKPETKLQKEVRWLRTVVETAQHALDKVKAQLAEVEALISK